MSKTIDLGKRPSELEDSIMPSNRKDEPYYPDLYIDSDDPKLADIPDKGECTIKYRVCSRTHREEGKDKDKKHSCSVRLEIMSITPPEKEKKKNGSYGDDARKSFGDYFKGK
jgi:hypothetical protein